MGWSTSVLDAALLGRANTSSAQLSHMGYVMQLAACAAGCVCAQHALGSGVPRRSMHRCARAASVHAQNAHIIHA